MRSSFSPAFSTSAVRPAQTVAGKWNGELLLRYAAATATTWIALAGAQLIIATNFALILAFLALLGVPVSLYLRHTDMHIGKISVPRPLWNGLTVVGSGVVGILFLLPTITDMLMMWRSEPQSFWLRFGGGDSLGLLMQAFLVFAALRSFAIISDKDATLTTIPSFSVLLLLIPVHKGIEVVCYFLAWTVVATILFALDHRSEMSAGVIARVPSPIPGQDVRLAARSLLTVLGVSLSAAVGISMYLTSRNPEDRSEAETAITSLAARLTQFALSLPDGSVNSGPERQIDFSSGPNLPSRAELWRAQALTLEKNILRPDYWRLFSLSIYNGSSWSQVSGRQKSVKKSPINWIRGDFWNGFMNTTNDRTPRFDWWGGNGVPGRGDFWGRFPPEANRPRRSDGGSDRPLSPEERLQRDQFRGGGPFFMQPPIPPGFNPNANVELTPVPNYPGVFSRKEDGFKIGTVSVAAHQYGGPTAPTRVIITAQNANLGFVPLLPGVSTLRLGSSQRDQGEVRVSLDGATDLGVMQAGERAFFTGQVPRLVEYGYRGGTPPLKRVAAAQRSAQLDPKEREINLQLPKSVTTRTRAVGTRALRGAAKDESNYSLAQRLAREVQQNAVYTLRPPAVPDGRDATDFFLFDGSKRGYCTYFAGALTVLCRTQGIPARVVSGFASPEYVANSNQAILRDANAHAWTEVWVDNWGWAVVDATPADDRGDNSPTWIESWSDWIGATLDSMTRNIRAQWPLLAVAGVGGLLLFVRWRRLRAGRNLSRGPQHSELQRREIVSQYERMSHLLSRRFRPRAAWETPDEWLAAAESALPQLPVEALHLVTRLYLQAQFSPRPLDAAATTHAKDAVQNVRQFQWRRKMA